MYIHGIDQNVFGTRFQEGQNFKLIKMHSPSEILSLVLPIFQQDLCALIGIGMHVHALVILAIIVVLC